MTAFATRAPLQLIANPHIMSEPREPGRRSSKRLEQKDDAPLVNGIGHENEPLKGSKSDVGKQGRGKANGVSAKPAPKRKPEPAYDEEDDGFTFTRTRAKKAKTQPILPPTIEEQKPEERAEPSHPPKRSRKKSDTSPNTAPTESDQKTGRRRSARHSGEHENADPPPLPVKKRRKVRSSSETKADQGGEQPPSKDSQPHNRSPRPEDPKQDHTQPIEITFDATKIALPFADTPRIQRNKDMRKTNAARRSSLGLRGRRASSLIDAGKSTAMPHGEVETPEFYKHIESEGLSEPRRMKQLLTWCGTRALGEKPTDYSSEDGNARLAAREIQNQLLKDFSKRSELSDWFSRNESTPPPSLPKPNPKNISNEAKIKDLELQIARLKTERESWESLLQQPPPPSLIDPSQSDPSTTSEQPQIDAALLPSPTQTSALETLHSFSPPLPSTTQSRLQSINQDLEFSIDKFAHNTHALSAFKDVAEGLADEVLGASARQLEERDREGKSRAGGEGGEVGMRDVLRGLSRVVER